MPNENEFFIPINEVAKQLGVPAYTLRYWEKQFPGAIRPVTGAGNRRYYRRETVDKIVAIKSLLYDKGMTITGVKKVLHNGSFKDEIKTTKKPVSYLADAFVDNDTVDEKPAISPLDMGDIDAAIKLLTQAKSFLD